MQKYSSKGRKPSGVIAYEIGEDFIIIKFKSGAPYTYTYATAGANAVEKMKQLAVAQKGLSTYISQNKPRYVTNN